MSFETTSAKRPLVWLGVLLCLALLCLGYSVAPAQALDVPSYRGYVSDYAGMLSPGTVSQLESALQSFEQSDSTQVAILTVASLEGDSLEDFSIRVADQWKIGQKGKDNGVLLLVAKKERRMRIEVGRGLEGVLTDLLAGRIIDTVITPFFKQGEFDQGILAGTAAVIQATRGEFKAGARPFGRNRPHRGGEPSPLISYLFIAAVFTAFLGKASRPLGILAGAMLLPLVFLLGMTSAFGLLWLLLLIPIGGLGGLLLPFLLAASMHSRGGYMGGGFGGGLGGGGGFGGFGGGGFGGGGASGGW